MFMEGRGRVRGGNLVHPLLDESYAMGLRHLAYRFFVYAYIGFSAQLLFQFYHFQQ